MWIPKEKCTIDMVATCGEKKPPQNPQKTNKNPNNKAEKLLETGKIHRVKGRREKAPCLLVLQAGVTCNGPRSPTKPGQRHPFSHVYPGKVDHQGEGQGGIAPSTLSSHPSPPAVAGKDKEQG